MVIVNHGQVIIFKHSRAIVNQTAAPSRWPFQLISIITAVFIFNSEIDDNREKLSSSIVVV